MRALTATLVVGAGLLASACLRRDVSLQEPTTKISFETTVNQPAVDKIDLLVMVDNSGSMADKQRILADAVPDLVRGLIEPKCVDKKTREPLPGNVVADPLVPPKDACPAGSEPAFPPVTDMHIGVISSSLGGFGSKSCGDSGTNDRAHLLARGADGNAVPQAGDLHFLAWYPDVEANRDKQIHPDPPVPKLGKQEDLSAAFKNLVVGAGQTGCGLEAQLESVYRFLVQPDPWESIQIVGGKATYGADGTVDEELLRQRAAFLRPDSLVAVIVLSDEDDSSVDPFSFQGTGWNFMGTDPMPRPTPICASAPADPKCTSCGFEPPDPSCTPPLKYTDKEDPLNVRFQRMKQRFGADPQYPIKRYVNGLREPKVPRRLAEHAKNGIYQASGDCTNPLFAARLPSKAGDELCKLPRGSRSRSSVYFAIIGGVPNTLLPEPDQNGVAKVDWTKVLGANPDRWDESGIDPHMMQSVGPRPGLPPPGSSDDADPVHGREWDTEGADLQFACTFPLYEKDATGVPQPVRRDCPSTDRTCDCNGSKTTPLCDPSDRKIQIRGKAYPTRRELLLAKELGENGIAASLCPKQLTNVDGDDYGYRPAVRAITDRLERARIGACVPRPLVPKEDGQVSCIVAAILPDAGSDTECQSRFGLINPRPEILGPLRDKLASDEGEDARRRPICELPQLPPVAGDTCRDEEEKVGFCYAENVPRASCRELLLFSKATRKLVNARFTLQCIQVSEGGN